MVKNYSNFYSSSKQIDVTSQYWRGFSDLNESERSSEFQWFKVLRDMESG